MSIGNAWVKEIWPLSGTPGLKNGALAMEEPMRGPECDRTGGREEDGTAGSAVPPGVRKWDCSGGSRQGGMLNVRPRSDSDQTEEETAPSAHGSGRRCR